METALFIGIGVTAVGLLIFLSWRDRRSLANLVDERLLKKYVLVILRRSPLDVEEEKMEAAATAAWAERFGANTGGNRFVSSCVPHFTCLFSPHGNMFVSAWLAKGRRNMARPTTFYPASASRVWDDFTHDVSIGLGYNYDTHPWKIAEYVGRLTAEMCDDDSLAIVHIHHGILWKLDDDVIERLRSDPESFFEPKDGDSEA